MTTISHPNSKKGKVSIRLLPIYLALCVLIAVPTFSVFYLQTSLTTIQKEQLRATQNIRSSLNLSPIDNSKSQNTTTIMSTTEFSKNQRVVTENGVSVYGGNGSFQGTGWVNKERTVSKKILAETPWARCETHSVLSEDGKNLVNDWLWMEEKDHINVAVMDDISGKFVVMKQKKYGIDGESLSTVGGFVETGETPFEAAVREVKEELGLGSRVTLQSIRDGSNSNVKQSFKDGRVSKEEENDWVFLGKYRTGTNRGGGFVYDYFLKSAIPLVEYGGTDKFKSIGEGEKQNILQLTIQDTITAVKDAKFKEVKWTNALSLSLLHYHTEMINVKQ